MIHNTLISTEIHTVEKFYECLLKEMPVELIWKKNRKECDPSEANRVVIMYEGKKLLERLPNKTCVINTQVAGDKEALVLKIAKCINLAEEPSNGIMIVQIIAYIVLAIFAISSRPEMAMFLVPMVLIALTSMVFYSLACFSSCSRGTRILFSILLMICLLPTAPGSMLLAFAGINLNKLASYKRIQAID